jgi:UDP-2-acetamido-2-deoxy-ribo-hexuluronate aminotransferase
MDTLQAAIILSKMTLFPGEVPKRAALGARYSELLAGAACTTPHIAEGNLSVYAQYTLRVADREALGQHLKESGVPTAVHYPVTLDQQPALSGRCRISGSLATAHRVAREVISLPMHPYLGEDDMQRVAAAVTAGLD